MKNINITKTILVFVMVIHLASFQAFGCTTAFLNNTGKANVVGRSMDLDIADMPKILVSPRGINRNGQAGENSLAWSSKYGSVAVAEFGTDAISDGMNEEGLSVHLLFLAATQYEIRNPKRPGVANVFWGQYLLDNFKTVNEALAAMKQIQIVATPLKGKMWPIHVSLQDASGDAGIIEFIDGKLKIYHGPQFRVMTNEPPYDKQLNNLKKYQHFGGVLSLPGNSDPSSRFVRAWAYLKTLPAPQNDLQAITQILAIIRIVTVPPGAVYMSAGAKELAWPTRWLSMSDLSNKVYYFSSTVTPNVIWLDFKNLNFSQGQPINSLDPIDKNLSGEISQQLNTKPNS